MLLSQVSFGVWRMGSQAMFSFLEIDKDYNTLYSMTYPITHKEAIDLSRWATNRARSDVGDPLMETWGWSVFMSEDNVVYPDITFRPLAPANRRDPLFIKEYRELVSRPHTAHYHSVD